MKPALRETENTSNTDFENELDALCAKHGIAGMSILYFHDCRADSLNTGIYAKRYLTKPIQSSVFVEFVLGSVPEQISLIVKRCALVFDRGMKSNNG
jgi:hypothetical protein